MRQSKLFGKTQKIAKRDMKFASHKLLYRGGFVSESVAGRYYYLPLGLKVRNKIIEITREEMNKTGAQEILTPVLHPLELWEETNRVDASNFELMEVEDRRGAKFALGGTAEEMMVDLVRKFNITHKDLPFNIYQFSQKFRDELRARGGLLRLREFVMKDGYSFHADDKDFEKEYKAMWDVYQNVYKRVGLDALAVPADNGYFGGEYSHEFIVETTIGESKFLQSKDGEYIAHEDIAKFKREDVNLKDKEEKFEIVKQPKWVKTMEDNIKHYKLPKSRFIKNVVFKNRVTKEIIIVVIRGDLDVNKNKLEKALNAVGVLEDATEKDLKSIGTKYGYVHSWGHKGARYIGDLSLSTVRNFIGGQKKDGTDSINVNYGRDFECEMLADVALAKEGHFTEDGKSELVEKRGVEVGNIFQLGCHYSEKMKNATFTDTDGKEKPLYMGCYGLGIGRTLASIVEVHNDDRGIIWPKSIAPYDVHLIGLDTSKAERVYKKLVDAGVDVLWDDRDVSAGTKFADADLIGISVRLVVSEKTGDKVEWKERASEKTTLITLDVAIKKLS